MRKTIAQLVALLVFLSTFGMGSTPLELHDAKRQTMGISAAFRPTWVVSKGRCT